jgi:hypothetical protein
MLAVARDRVVEQMRAGRTLAEIQAAKPLADLDGTWGRGFMTPDSFLAAVYSGLARTQGPGRPAH